MLDVEFMSYILSSPKWFAGLAKSVKTLVIVLNIFKAYETVGCKYDITYQL